MAKQPCVYILASGRIGTIYVGVTSDLIARVYQHRSGSVPGCTSRYGVTRLVRYEFYPDMPTAIAREKQLKRWHREWKINLIEQDNPDWQDMAIGLGLGPVVPAVRARSGAVAARSRTGGSRGALDPETRSG